MAIESTDDGLVIYILWWILLTQIRWIPFEAMTGRTAFINLLAEVFLDLFQP